MSTYYYKFILRILLFFSAIFSLPFFTSISAYASDFEIVDNILVGYHGSGGNITIPGTVEKINSNVFLNNSHITTVNIQEGVFEICDNAFDGCNHMQKVHLPNTLKRIGRRAFANCRKMKEINLPPNLTKIDEEAFSGCKTFEKVSIPKSVSFICYSAFNNCTGIKSFKVASDNKAYTSEDDVLYTADKKTLLAYPLGKNEEQIQIRDGVINIERCAFAYHPTLQKIIFPPSVKELQPFSFSCCLGLKEVTFPKTLKKIYQYAFMYCTNLNRVYYEGKDIETSAHAYDCCYSLIIYADEDSKAYRHTSLYNMNWLPLDDTKTIILPTEKSKSHIK